MRIAALLLLVALPAGAAELHERTDSHTMFIEGGPCPESWRKTFRSSTRIFMPVRLKNEWKWIVAQATAESGCRPRVCSKAGACGVLQLLEGTWKDQMKAVSMKSPAWRKIKKELMLDDSEVEHKPSIFDAKLNIIYGVRYMSWLCKNFLGRNRVNQEILELCTPAFNAGLGHILTAQIKCFDARLWPDVKVCLPQVTGRHSKETIEYVQRIKRWRKRLGK